MESVKQDQRREAPPSVHASPAWVGWALASFGLGIGIVSGAASAFAWPARNWIGVIIGALMALCGVLALVAGLVRIRDAARAASSPAEAGGDTALPRLGEILVHKYQLISEKDVQKALTRQRETVGRPLGEILVEMRKITWRDLTRALEDQLGYGDPWKRK